MLCNICISGRGVVRLSQLFREQTTLNECDVNIPVEQDNVQLVVEEERVLTPVNEHIEDHVKTPVEASGSSDMQASSSAQPNVRSPQHETVGVANAGAQPSSSVGG